MDKQYNLYNLEASFKEYLLAGKNKPVSIKNYLSDFRHFAGWITFYLKSNVGVDHRVDPHKDGHIGLSLQFITANVINEYKSYLSENNIPSKTINRRLSTVRKFCSFCISQGWMKENPGKQVQNSNIKDQNQDPKLKTKEFLTQFKQDLIKEKVDKSTINSYLNDIQEFLSI